MMMGAIAIFGVIGAVCLVTCSASISAKVYSVAALSALGVVVSAIFLATVVVVSAIEEMKLAMVAEKKKKKKKKKKEEEAERAHR